MNIFFINSQEYSQAARIVGTFYENDQAIYYDISVLSSSVTSVACNQQNP